MRAPESWGSGKQGSPDRWSSSTDVSRIGEAMSPPLIRAVKEKINPHKVAILDAPPGASCPVINTVMGSDFIILVTEPTPFGLHDLRIAVEALHSSRNPSRRDSEPIRRWGSGSPEVLR